MPGCNLLACLFLSLAIVVALQVLYYLQAMYQAGLAQVSSNTLPLLPLGKQPAMPRMSLFPTSPAWPSLLVPRGQVAMTRTRRLARVLS